MSPVSPEFEETPYGLVKRLKTIESWLPPNSRLKILDFGCGTGEHITYPLAKAGHDVFGVDMHAPSIDLARQNYALPNLQFKVAGEVNFAAEGEFDVVVCSEVLEHLQDPLPLLIHFYKILKSKGRLIVTTPNGRGSYEILCGLERILQKLGIHQAVRGMAGTPAKDLSSAGFLNFESTHVQFFRLRELERLFREARFQILARRSRTLLCGPYVDLLFKLPFKRPLIRLNATVTDILPMQAAADWMFLLSKA